MPDRQTTIDTVSRFLKECRSLPIAIDKAILFGSHVYGKANENSDIDLALFSDSFTENILNNLDMVARINIRFPEIDVHTYPITELESNGLLLDEIKSKGWEMVV